jgi:hypothetical protein
MTRPTFTVKAWTGWDAVARGELAHRSTHDNREEALALRDALPFPLVDVIRHDDTGGRVITTRAAWPHPADVMGAADARLAGEA